MTYVTLLVLGLILQASMGLSPPSPSDQTRKLYSRAAHTVGGVLVAATLLAAPLPAEATLTTQDLNAIVKIVKDTVKESEERTQVKMQDTVKESEERTALTLKESEERTALTLKESEERTALTLKESEERTALKIKESEDRMTVKIDKIENMYILVPVGTTVGAAIVATISNFFASKSLENAIASFVGEKETIKKELEANTLSKAFQGTFFGVSFTIALIGFGAAAYAAIHHPQ